MSEEAKKPFTVTDRRHFTAEGERREDQEAAAARPKPPEPAAPRNEPAAPRNPTPPAPAAPAAAEAGPSPVVDGPGHRTGPPIDFAGLLLSLGAQAGYLLRGGGGGDPTTDLEGARAIIELLEVLRDKTQGRRTPEEDEILEGILYELRMEFVARTRVSGT